MAFSLTNLVKEAKVSYDCFFTRRQTDEDFTLNFSAATYPKFEKLWEVVAKQFKITDDCKRIIFEDEENREYECPYAQIWKLNQFHDERLLRYRDEFFKVENDADWHRAVKGMPWSKEKWTSEAAQFMEAKLRWQSDCADDDPELKRLEEREMSLEGMKGLWSIVYDKENHAQITSSMLEALVSLMAIIDYQEEERRQQLRDNPPPLEKEESVEEKEARKKEKEKNKMKKKKSQRMSSYNRLEAAAKPKRKKKPKEFSDDESEYEDEDPPPPPPQPLKKEPDPVENTEAQNAWKLKAVKQQAQLMKQLEKPKAKQLVSNDLNFYRPRRQRAQLDLFDVKDGNPSFSASALRVYWFALSAMHCLSITRPHRHTLLQLGALEYTLDLMQVTTEEWGELIGKKDTRLRDQMTRLHAQALSTLAMLVVDEVGRNRLYSPDGSLAYAAVDQTTAWRLLAKLSLSGATNRIKLLAARTLCGVLNFDAKARKLFTFFGGMKYLDQIIALKLEEEGVDEGFKVQIAVYICSVLIQYGRTEEGREELLKEGACVQRMMLFILERVSAAVLRRHELDSKVTDEELDITVCALVVTTNCTADEHALVTMPDPHSVITNILTTVEGALGMNHPKPLVEARGVQMNLIGNIVALSANVLYAKHMLSIGIVDFLLQLIQPKFTLFVRMQGFATLLRMARIPKSSPWDRNDLGGELCGSLIEGGVPGAMLEMAAATAAKIEQANTICPATSSDLAEAHRHSLHERDSPKMTVASIVQELVVPPPKNIFQKAHRKHVSKVRRGSVVIKGVNAPKPRRVTVDKSALNQMDDFMEEYLIILRGCTAIIMHLAATGIPMSRHQMARLVTLCRQGDRLSQQYAGAALWCCASRDQVAYNNCQHLAALDALGDRKWSISAMLHYLLISVTSWGHAFMSKTSKVRLDEREATVVHMEWLLGTAILVLNHAPSVLWKTVFSTTSESANLDRGISPIMENKDEMDLSDMPPSDPMYKRLLLVCVRILQLDGNLGYLLAKCKFLASNLVHRLVNDSNDPRLNILLPLVQGPRMGLLHISQDEAHTVQLRVSCVYLYLLVCEACGCRPDGTKDPEVFQTEERRRREEEEEAARQAEEEERRRKEEEEEQARLKQEKEEKRRKAGKNATPTPPESEKDGEEEEEKEQEAPPQNTKVDFDEDPLDQVCGDREFADPHSTSLQLLSLDAQPPNGLMITDERLLEAGVILCGHLAFKRRKSQARLVQGGVVPLLSALLLRNPPISPRMVILILRSLLNLSTLPEAQLQICQHLLRKLLQMNEDERAWDAHERMRLTSGILSNLFLNPGNRNRFYKEEIRMKSRLIAEERDEMLEEWDEAMGPMLSMEEENELLKLDALSEKKKEFYEWAESLRNPDMQTQQILATKYRRRRGRPDKMKDHAKDKAGSIFSSLPDLLPHVKRQSLTDNPEGQTSENEAENEAGGSSFITQQASRGASRSNSRNPSTHNPASTSLPALPNKYDTEHSQQAHPPPLRGDPDEPSSSSQEPHTSFPRIQNPNHTYPNPNRGGKHKMKVSNKSRVASGRDRHQSSGVNNPVSYASEGIGGKLLQKMNRPLQNIWKPVVGQNEGMCCPTTAQGGHAVTPNGSRIDIKALDDHWRPLVQASVLGPVPPPNEHGGVSQAPITVELAPGRRRNRIHFDLDKPYVNLQPEKDFCKLSMWKHIEGSKVGEELYPKYVLPDGRTFHFYQTKKTLVDEVRMDFEPPPPLPLTLLSMQLHMLPSSEPVIKALLLPQASLIAPSPLKPRPPPCPKPEKSYYLHFREEPAFLVTGEEANDGDYGPNETGGLRRWIRPKTPPPPPEEIIEVPSWEDAVFKKHHSLFAPRHKEADGKSYFNTNKVLNAEFELDWTRMSSKSGLQKALGGEEVMASLKSVLQPHYPMMKAVFEEYASSDEKSPFFLSLNQFTSFIMDCEFIDNNSANCRQADVDTLFIVANLKDGDKEAKFNKLNPERSLALFDFIDIIVRISVVKYSKDEEHKLPPPQAIEKFMKEHFVPAAEKNQVQPDADLFRRERFYNEYVETVFKDNLPTLKTLFNYFKSTVRSKRMPSGPFIDMLVKCQLLGDDLAMATREALYCFVKSRMVVIDQFEKKDKHETLSFIDFLEALARVADCLSPPSYEDLEALELDLTAFEVHQQQLSGLINLARRESCGLTTPKSRPLDEKVSALLGIISGMLCQYYDVEDEQHLRKKLKAETKFDEGLVK